MAFIRLMLTEFAEDAPCMRPMMRGIWCLSALASWFVISVLTIVPLMWSLFEIGSMTMILALTDVSFASPCFPVGGSNDVKGVCSHTAAAHSPIAPSLTLAGQ